MVKRNGKPTAEQSPNEGETGVPVSRRRLIQFAGAGLVGVGAVASQGSAASSPDRLEIVASGGALDYSFTCDGPITPVRNKGFTSAESGDTVTENGDGTWTATGKAEAAYGDAFDIEGDVSSFQPVDGDYRLYLNGERTTREELVVESTHELVIDTPDDGSVEYEMTTTGGITKNLDNGVLSAEAGNDMVTENDDGTWTVTGLTGNGYGDTLSFEGDVLDFAPMEGSFSLHLDGTEVTTYELTGKTSPEEPKQTEEREHTYSFEGTGDSWTDYYLEVEDGGNMIESTVDGAVIEPDFHWISDDGTKAAGRVDPGERHAYAFDSLVLDVTIEGEADAYVNGSPSAVDWYPRPGATGDEWKGGFPWQDEEADTTVESSSSAAIGGGDGYDNTVPQSASDAVARSSGELADALSAAGAGDVVYVPSDEELDLGNREYNVPSGVTLASGRGIDGSAGALLSTDEEVGELIRLHGDARLTGVRVFGPHPGDDWGGSSSAGGVETLGPGEIDNCEVVGFSHHGIQADSGGDAHIHHNVVRECNTSGLGYGVSADSGHPVIEYNYFNYNRHSVASSGSNHGYTCRYNHFGPTEVLHNIDAHEPAGVSYEIHNNVIETLHREWDDNMNHIVVVRGAPDDEATIRDNWFFNGNAPDPNGPTNEAGQAIVQINYDDWTNMSFSSNYYGEDAAVSYGDVIPGYDGFRTA